MNTNFDPHGDESIIAIQWTFAERHCPNHIPPKGNIDTLIQIFQTNTTAFPKEMMSEGNDGEATVR